jgi:hypothetical protein
VDDSENYYETCGEEGKGRHVAWQQGQTSEAFQKWGKGKTKGRR